ncbi:hypothetical protein CXB51_013849 [Gossypium anomalum]|uniref:RNase H type-1 domain-containing protein n=1 Tax=Gossypium anomalum TaxID=47600 RepID=A0A8J5Z366_9ROSI|nr:hypothetical protein CXB51_013849 [Gossypium anomalum]
MAQFNISLLAKQGWRIINNLNSLVARVLKAKYFPNNDFINSRLENTTSYTWISIWATKGILAEGLCWRVGTSMNVTINNDASIPDAETFRLSSFVHNMQDSKVTELIDTNKRIWKRELIVNTFLEGDAKKILRIPLAQEPHDHFLVWSGEPSRAETSDHLFRECPVLVKFWTTLSFSNTLIDTTMDFTQWLTWVFDQCPPHHCRIFCCALWAIWGDRNARIHEKKISIGQEIARFVNNYITELNGIKKRNSSKPQELREWSHPPDSIVKINFDGAYDGCHYKSASGIVVRNAEGIIHLSCSETQKEVASTFATEALACRKAV